MISLELLERYVGKIVNFKKGEIIFHEDDRAKNYFQIVSGKVRMFNQKEDGKQFIQGVFERNESFGEPPLFIEKKYPATAIACVDSEIYKLERSKFFILLEEHPEIYPGFLKLLANRVYNKAKTGKLLSQSQPETRINSLFFQLKNKEAICKNGKTLICLTRQEIADLTGLRVETVIRAIKKMEEDQILVIKDRKVYV